MNVSLRHYNIGISETGLFHDSFAFNKVHRLPTRITDVLGDVMQVPEYSKFLRALQIKTPDQKVRVSIGVGTGA